MAFPATATFQSQAGPVDVTITGHPEQTHAPHMLHLSTQAGVCAHFLISELDDFADHLADLIESAQPPAAPAPAPAETTVPFTFATVPPPRDGSAHDDEDDDGDPGVGAVTTDPPTPGAPAVSAVQPFLTAEADA